jgi:hypothetical protein
MVWLLKVMWYSRKHEGSSCSTWQLFHQLEHDHDPQDLDVPIMTSASKDDADIGVAVSAAMAHHEIIAQSDLSADPFMIHCRYMMSFCKAVTEGHASPTLCSPSDDHIVAEWAHNLYTKLIMPRAAPQAGGGSVGPSDETLQQVSDTMSNMAMTLAHKHEFVVQKRRPPALQSLDHMRRSWLFLLPHLMLIRLSRPQCQPMPFFLGIKSIGGAREHLKNELKAAHGADFIPPPTLTAVLSIGSFMWDQPDLPSHVSFFFCGNTGHFGYSSEESL